MRDMDILDEAEHSVYLQFYDHLVAMNQIIDLAGVIYVQCDPETCEQRIKTRSREGEDTIPLDYLQRIHTKHELWLNPEKENRQPGQKQEKILILDNTQPINRERVIEVVGRWLKGDNQ